METQKFDFNYKKGQNCVLSCDEDLESPWLTSLGSHYQSYSSKLAIDTSMERSSRVAKLPTR